MARAPRPLVTIASSPRRRLGELVSHPGPRGPERSREAPGPTAELSWRRRSRAGSTGTDNIARAFRSEKHRDKLPTCIRGLWRADLFVGSPKPDQWVATTLKIKPTDLEADAGIRIGIYPEKHMGEKPVHDEAKNLILCPLPYEAGFMELFYESFGIVRTFLHRLWRSRLRSRPRVASGAPSA
jgi:hypothetical protein